MHRRYDDRPLAGRYLLLDEVGLGAMGSVWRAWDRREGRHLAVKLLAHHDEALLQRFVREQAVRVTHPHVVAPTGWAVDEDRVLLTMDLVAGGSVATLLREHGALPEGMVVALLDQLLQALVAVHAAGVVHRDVKPANLLLEPTGLGPLHLRLADFGVAALISGERLTRGGPVGTPGFCAPEQDAGAPADPRQDLYAVGVVGRLLLLGVEPTTGFPALALRTPGRLGPLLDLLADPDPVRRPAGADDALHRLRRLGLLPDPSRERWPEVPDRLGPAPTHRRRPDPDRLVTLLACVCFLSAIGLSLAAAYLVT